MRLARSNHPLGRSSSLGAHFGLLVHRGLDEFAEEVREAVRDATEEILLQPDLVTFKDDLTGSSPDDHTIVAYLANQAGASDATVGVLMADALAHQIPVLPLSRTSDPGAVSDKLPNLITRINAIDWDARRGEALAAILAMLGLTEPERRVFLSYFRNESTPLAVQMHTALAQARFDVFLDRFTVPPSVDFQKRLEEDLGDKAFLVLIESPGLRTSHWVEHEIAYAHAHRIGILAVTLPGTADAELVPSIDEAFRVRLHVDDVQATSELTDAALRRLLDRVEVAHARELRRRREQLIGSLRDKLFVDGCTCEPVGDWAVLATAPGRRSAVFLITPRRPRPEDLYALHLVHLNASVAVGAELNAAVVHETEHIAEEQLALLRWIGEPRQFEAMLLRGCVLLEDPAA